MAAPAAPGPIAGPALVTGATGFIGRRLVARLCAASVPVRALALPDERTDGVLPAGVEVVRGDVTDRASVRAALCGIRTVFHLAAIVGDWGPEDLFQRVTVGGTESVLADLEPGARLVLASSVVVYGDRIGLEVCTEETPHGRPLGPYSRTKQAQERLALEAGRAHGLSVTALRLTNVYGPGSKPWVHDLLEALRRRDPVLVGGREKCAGLCHVDNAVQGFVRAAAATAAPAGRAYNIADGSDVTWARYASDLARLGGAPEPRGIAYPLAKLAATGYETLWRLLRRSGRPPITHEALNLVASHHRVPIDKARKELGYEPEVGYEAGLASVAAYLREIGAAR